MFWRHRRSFRLHFSIATEANSYVFAANDIIYIYSHFKTEKKSTPPQITSCLSFLHAYERAMQMSTFFPRQSHSSRPPAKNKSPDRRIRRLFDICWNCSEKLTGKHEFLSRARVFVCSSIYVHHPRIIVPFLTTTCPDYLNSCD